VAAVAATQRVVLSKKVTRDGRTAEIDGTSDTVICRAQMQPNSEQMLVAACPEAGLGSPP
jgi:hypothetical protein